MSIVSDYQQSQGKRGAATSPGPAPDITQQQQTVVNDLNANNFTGAWDTALGTSSMYGTNMNAQTTDPLLKDLESSAGLKQLDPGKQWTPAETAQFYQAFNQTPAFHGQGGADVLGKNPYGVWGSAAGIPGDIQANIAQEGATPDVGRFAGARPDQSFLGKYGTDIEMAALAAAAIATMNPELVGLDAGAGAAAGAAGAGAGTVASSAAGDIALTDATAGLATDAGGLAASDAAAAGLGSVGVDTAGVAGAAGGAGGMYTMPEVLSQGTAIPAATAGGGSALGDLAGGVGAGMGLGALAQGAGSAGTPMPSAKAADFGGAFASNSGSFLPATSDSSVSGLSPDIMQSLGINPVDASSIDPSMTDVSSLATDNPGYGPMDIANQTTGQSLGSYFSNPKNAASAGLLGISALQGLSKPKLPAAANTANANANALSKSALPVIQSGGTAGPQWAGQKASIDSTIDQQIQQQSQALQQAAANSGMGNQNSGVVQQQIAEMTRQANVQRQQLYQQAQQQNVSNAVSELTGADQTLQQIANMQLNQQAAARSAAEQTAQLALLLQTGTKQPPAPGS